MTKKKQFSNINSRLTFITVSDGVEVNVVRIAAEEQEAEPRLECIDGHDEENPNYPALLRPVCVAAKILIDLERKWADECYSGIRTRIGRWRWRHDVHRNDTKQSELSKERHSEKLKATLSKVTLSSDTQ